jgi:ABC-type lipoprotein release transport system permease subunit
MEALAITAIGLILGCALGAVNLYYQLELIRRDVGGMYLEYQYPFTLAALLVPVILAAALLSALAPGEFAVRQPLEEALRYE